MSGLNGNIKLDHEISMPLSEQYVHSVGYMINNIFINTFFRDAGQHGPVMLMYHSIVDDKGVPDWPWSVSLDRFREHLNFLNQQGWEAITMAELVSNPYRVSMRTAVITFDDGYEDNLFALDELKKRNMRASWFVVSGSVGAEPTWPPDGRPDGRLLNASELRMMHSCGMEICSHTKNHTRLTELNGAALVDELAESKDSLEDILGCAVTSFAYPYGVWDTRCATAVRDCGYTAACTTRTGWALRDNDPFQLRRLTVFNTDTVASLARKLYFGSNDVAWNAVTRYAVQRIMSRLNKSSP